VHAYVRTCPCPHFCGRKTPTAQRRRKSKSLCTAHTHTLLNLPISQSENCNFYANCTYFCVKQSPSDRTTASQPSNRTLGPRPCRQPCSSDHPPESLVALPFPSIRPNPPFPSFPPPPCSTSSRRKPNPPLSTLERCVH
jgi:hypothetical protein